MSKGETIALVSCVKSKAPGPWAAKDLYTSPLFRYMRAYAEIHADRWYILSAEHGLLHPDQRVRAYDATLNGMPAKQRRQWARRVYGQIDAAGLARRSVRFLWLAGKAYRHELVLLLQDCQHDDPLRGLGIGRRLSWLKAAIADSS